MNLNGSEFAANTVKVFNKGEAGKVENVVISEVVKRKVDDAPNLPDYKVIFQDQDGANMGWSVYHFSPKEGATPDRIASSQKYYLQRIVALGRAVLGSDYVFPDVKDAKDAVNVILKLVAKASKDVKLNLFVTYGTKDYPNKKGYLSLRYFDFIEPAETTTTDSKLFVKKDDLMERVVETLPKLNESLDLNSESEDDDTWV